MSAGVCEFFGSPSRRSSWRRSSGSASASSPPSVAVDVIAWPGEAAGPIEWKAWRVTASESMRTVTLALPPGALRERALRALMSDPQVPEGGSVGTATVTMREEPDAVRTIPVQMQVFGCQGGAGGLATLRFEVRGECIDLAVERAAGGFVVRADLSELPPVLRFELRLSSLQTGAGRLLPDNPPAAAASETVATVETEAGTGHGEVREISGGATGLSIALERHTAVYGLPLSIEGSVQRGAESSQGEIVLVDRFGESVAEPPSEPMQITTTGTDGRFVVTVRPTATAVWAAWSQAPLTGDRPRLNTLAAVAANEVVVRAPRPRIRKAQARRLGAKRVRARIVVWNPLAGKERLECRLFVGNRGPVVRHFGPGRARLVFRVTGSRRMKVRAVVRKEGVDAIAGRSSRVVRL